MICFYLNCQKLVLMAFKYRTQKYKDEDGEFTEYAECSKKDILNLINEKWVETNISNDSLKIISIQNDFEDNLLLVHFHKHVFDTYYLPRFTNHYFHRRSQMEVIYDCVDLFFAKGLPGLEKYLKKKTKETKYIRGDFLYHEHRYSLNNKRNLNQLLWLLLALPISISLIFLGIVIISPEYEPWTFIVASSSILILGGIFISLPGVLLHWQYHRDSKNLTVTITRGKSNIEIEHLGKKKSFGKKEIILVRKFFTNSWRNLWGHYGFTEIQFKNGYVVNLTNLIIDQDLTLEKFQFDDIEIMEKLSRIPFLKKKTKIN